MTAATARQCLSLPALAAELQRAPARGRRSILACLPDADFHVQIDAAGDTATVRLHATFREDRADGGTWWTGRTLRLRYAHGAPRPLEAAVVGEIEALRRHFARLLREARQAG